MPARPAGSDRGARKRAWPSDRRVQRRRPRRPISVVIALGVDALQIIEQTPALADHDQQPAPRVKILFVRAEMVGQVADAFRQDRDLHLGRAGIARLEAYSPISACLRSGVIDIGISLQRLMMRTGRSAPSSIRANATTEPVVPRADERALVNRCSIGLAERRSRRSRSVIRCPWRNRAASAAVKASAGMSSSAVSIGRRCSEAARLCPSDRGRSSEIACASVKRPTCSRRSSAIWPSVPSAVGEVAGQRADIGALADRGLEIGVIRVGHAEQPQFGDLDRARRQFRSLAGAGQRIGAAAGDLDRRIGGRALLDRAGESAASAAIAAASGPRRLSARSRPRGRRYRSRRPSGRGSGSACARRSRIARSSSPRRAPAATRRWRAGRACRRARPSRRWRA